MPILGWEMADIVKAKRELNYHPEFRIKEGLAKTVKWHLSALLDIITPT